MPEKENYWRLGYRRGGRRVPHIPVCITCFTTTWATTTTLYHPNRFFISSSSATTTATTSLIYYVMCLGARFCDYLAPSDVLIRNHRWIIYEIWDSLSLRIKDQEVTQSTAAGEGNEFSRNNFMYSKGCDDIKANNNNIFMQGAQKSVALSLAKGADQFTLLCHTIQGCEVRNRCPGCFALWRFYDDMI